MLNNSGESGHPCLVPDLRGTKVKIFPIENDVFFGLSYMSILMLKQDLSLATSWKIGECLLQINTEFCQKFFCIY